MDLYPHQIDAIEAAQFAMVEGCQRQVIQMATGAGKTITAGALIDSVLLPHERCLFLAHREDLLTQARDAFRNFFPDKDLGIVQAAHNEADKRIVFGMFQTLVNPRRLAQLQVAGPFPYVIVDECHHALAPSFRRVIDTLGTDVVVGLTATPSRADRQSLRKIFQQLTYSIGMVDLILSGHLVDLRGISIKTDLDLSRVGEDEWGDLNRAQMIEAVHKAKQRHGLAINTIINYAPDWQGIYFAADVLDARMFAEAATFAGIPTEVIVGTTTQEERQSIRERYLAGEIQYISNVQVLTEGTDLPPARVAIIGRPTKSQELYIQMVGRVCRVLPSDRGKPQEEWEKDHALVLDLADNHHTVLTLPDLIGSTEEIVRKKGVRQAVKEEQEREARTAEVVTPGTKAMSVQVATQSLLSKRPWRRQGMDWHLKTKYGNARLEADFGGKYAVMFETPNGYVTRLNKTPLKVELAMAVGEQKLDQLSLADTRREEQRHNPATRTQPASPKMAEVVKRLFPFLRARSFISAGEARDWLDKHEKAKKAGYASWWVSPEGIAWKQEHSGKSPVTTPRSRPKRAAKASTTSSKAAKTPRTPKATKLPSGHGVTILEE